MATNKPANISSKIWAALGDVETPTDVKMETGWVAEVPKAQVENWVQNRQDAFNAHVNERGIAEWDATTDYIANKSYVQGSNGNLYKSVQNTGPTTVVQDPTTDTVGTYWALAFSPYVHTHPIASIVGLQAALDSKQAVLVSGNNIKTVNGNSILGSGDITLPIGEVNTASNVGVGAGVFKEKVGGDLTFKSLVGVDGIDIVSTGDEIQISASGGGSTGILVFPMEADVPSPTAYPTPTLGFLQNTGELIYSDGTLWNALGVARTFAGGGGVDPYFENVSLLLHMNSIPLVDSSSLAGVVTNSGVTVSESVFKFGDGSAEFNGAAQLSLPHSTNLSMGLSDFTLEMWLYPTDLTGTRSVVVHRPALTATGMVVSVSNGILSALLGDANSVSWEVELTSPTITTNQWQHVALSRSGNTFRLFLNGTIVAETTHNLTINDSGGLFLIGANENGPNYDGYIDDFRLTKGVARYTANFTPPVSEFPDL